jgi:hypothetical protein
MKCLPNFTPQFDIASFYPQITFFAGTFLMFYAYVDKDILPRVGHNLKLNRKLSDIFNLCVGKGNGGVSLLTYIYGPSRTLSHAISAEFICLSLVSAPTSTIVITYVSALARLHKGHPVSSPKSSVLYLSALGDVLSK